MGVCIVENLSRVFLFEWPLILLWLIRVYIVWVKGKKVILKNSPGKMFRKYFGENALLMRHSRKQQPDMTFQLPTCASHVTISRVSF